MNIILAHDSFTQAGGAERVVDSLHKIFPGAPVYTSVVDKKYPADLSSYTIHTSWLQYIYNIFPRFQYLFPLVFPAVRSLRITEACDVLLSSSSSFAKALRKPPHSAHINYCHTPSRFLWSDTEHAISETPYLLRPFARLAITLMRRWDLEAVRNVDYFIANSEEVKERIKKYYNRESSVIHPFVDVHFWKPTQAKKDYFLISGRLQAHKHNDVVISAFNTLGIPLHVVGTGRQEEYLKSIAGPNVTFYGRVSDEELRNQYSGALGYLYPQHEDFGINPLEAAACGTATLGLARGGSLETVIPGVTGELIAEASEAEIIKYIRSWDVHKYNALQLQAHAHTFSEEKFQEKILTYIEKAVHENRH